jgi:hypothetical protein
MNLNLRRFIFYFFCLLFCIITPVIILYASGYEFNLKHLFTPLAIQKTGMTIIYSNPAGANIYLNNKKAEYFSDFLSKKFIPEDKNAIKTPARIKDLEPGSYDLRVELPGYWPWERRIEIFPGKITHVLDINLFKNNQPQKMAETSEQNIVLSPNGKKIFFPLSGQLFDIKSQSLEKFSTSNYASSTTALWSSDSNRLAAGKSLLNVKNPEKNLQLDKIIGSGITNLKWNDELDKIYYQHKDSINVYNINTGANQDLINGGKITDYEVKGKNIYYITTDELSAKLIFYSLTDKKISKEISLPSSDGYQFINQESKLINLYDQKYQILYLIDSSPSAVSPLLETINSVKTTQWISDNELVWANDYEIWVLDMEKNENKLITRWSIPIQNIIKTKANNYILYSTAKDINVITWTPDDNIQVTQLASFDSIAAPVFDDNEKNIYFTASKNNETNLYHLNIQ